MQFKSLLITLGILGSASFALADPDTYPRRDRYDRTYDRTYDRYDRYDRGDYRRHNTWTPLTQVNFDNDGDDVFVIDARDRFQRLRIQNQGGRTRIHSISIEYGNGQTERVPVNRVLRGAGDMLNIELPGRGRRIERVVVFHDQRRRGAYQIYAM